MKAADLKTKDSSELQEMLKELQVKLGRLSFERQRKTLKKSHEVSQTRKTIAQIKTFLHERTN
jgi:ribosomal protein L29